MKIDWYVSVSHALFRKKKKKKTEAPKPSSPSETINLEEIRRRERELLDKETQLRNWETSLRQKDEEIAIKLQELMEREAELDRMRKEVKKLEETLNERGKLEEKVDDMWLRDDLGIPDMDDIMGQEEIIQKLEARLERANQHLEKLKEIENMRKEYRAKIEEYKNEGYNVSELESVIEGNIEDVKKIFEKFEGDIELLKILEERLEVIDDVFENEKNEIRKKIKDPSAISEIEGKLDEIEKRVEEKKKELMQKVQAWKDEGYDVSRLEGIEEKSIRDVEKALIQYEEDVDVLKMFEEKLSEVDPVFADEIAEALNLTKNPDNIHELERIIGDLEMKMGEKKEELTSKINLWRDEGYVVDVFDDLLNGDLATLEDAVLKYEEGLQNLQTLSAKLEEIDPIFQQEKDKIKEKMNDPTLIPEIEAAIVALEEETMKRKEEFRAKINEYKEKGYKVDRLEVSLDGTIGEIEEELTRYAEGVEKLEKLAERARNLAEKGYEKEIEIIKDLLNDPYSVIQLEKELIEIEEKRMEEEKPAVAADELAKAAEKPAVAKEQITEAKEEEKVEIAKPKEEEKAEESPAEKAERIIEDAKNLVNELEEVGKSNRTIVNLLKLARSFYRGKNYDKAIQYGERVLKMGEKLK